MLPDLSKNFYIPFQGTEQEAICEANGCWYRETMSDPKVRETGENSTDLLSCPGSQME